MTHNGPMELYLRSPALDIFQTLINDLDAEGHYLFHNAIANQLRYPNDHTHLFSFVLLHLFNEANQFLYGLAHVLKLLVFRQASEVAFAECDTGGNGYISEHELGVTIRHDIPDLNDAKIHYLFNLFDGDRDGKVSKDDFVSCLRRNPLLVAVFAPSLLRWI